MGTFSTTPLGHSSASGHQLLPLPVLCFRTPLSVRKELLCVQCPGFPPGTLAFRLLESNTSASPGSGGQRGFCWWAAREETVNGQQPQGTARDKRPRSPVYERGLVAHPRSGSLRGRLPIDASQGCPPSSPGTSGGALFSPPAATLQSAGISWRGAFTCIWCPGLWGRPLGDALWSPGPAGQRGSWVPRDFDDQLFPGRLPPPGRFPESRPKRTPARR